MDEHPDWIREQHGFDESVRSRLVLPNTWVSWEACEQKVEQYVHRFMLKHKGRPSVATYNPTIYDYGSLVEALRVEMAARPKGSGTANPLPPDALPKADRA